ncbi:MAG: type II secretion system protein [Bacilli bacterium]|nr:type II secretion system protein [Bacilli bacterium]
MNRKGFTLIELLAVIVVLAIVLAIAVPSISNAYKNSKLKSEELFVERLSDVIDSYVKLNSTKIRFEKENYSAKKEEDSSSYFVDIYKGTITVENIIDDNLIGKNDYVNPSNKVEQCNLNAEIEIYRDSDFVYCYKLSKYKLNCLTDKYREKLKIPATETTEAIDIVYAIDTCVWSKQ